MAGDAQHKGRVGDVLLWYISRWGRQGALEKQQSDLQSGCDLGPRRSAFIWKLWSYGSSDDSRKHAIHLKPRLNACEQALHEYSKCQSAINTMLAALSSSQTIINAAREPGNYWYLLFWIIWVPIFVVLLQILSQSESVDKLHGMSSGLFQIESKQGLTFHWQQQSARVQIMCLVWALGGLSLLGWVLNGCFQKTVSMLKSKDSELSILKHHIQGLLLTYNNQSLRFCWKPRTGHDNGWFMRELIMCWSLLKSNKISSTSHQLSMKDRQLHGAAVKLLTCARSQCISYYPSLMAKAGQCNIEDLSFVAILLLTENLGADIGGWEA